MYRCQPRQEIPLRNPRDFFKPLAIGAPDPIRELEFKPSRMIHFFDASNEKMAAKLPDLAAKCDILLGNLEDAVPVDRKEAAREGLVNVGKTTDFGDCQLWTRVNSLESPWVLDDLTRLVGEIGHKLDVIMVPKVEGAWDIHYVDRLLAQLEAKAGLDKPILVHAILETALGVVNLEEIAAASPRMQGMSFGPADLAASRRMKTTRVGGGHPGYRVIEDPNADDPDAPRATAQQDPWHYSIARMVDACTSNAILPFYGPFGDIKDTVACEAQFRSAFLLGCVGAWSLHPVQIEIAKKVFSPDPDEVAFAKKVIEAIPDGRGVHMIDGKMQDDATWKQCQVMVHLAEMLARKDADLAELYGFTPTTA
jgi:malyl-CoA/(S)-citramalyl-CoA lyase